MTIAILPVFLCATTNQQQLVCPEVQVWQCSSTCCNTRQGINSLANSESRLKTTEPKFSVHFNGLSLLARKFISGRDGWSQKPGFCADFCLSNPEFFRETGFLAQDSRLSLVSHSERPFPSPHPPVSASPYLFLERRQLIALPDYYHRDWQPPSPSLPTTPPPAIPFQEHVATAEKPSLPPPIAIQKPVQQVSPPQPARQIAPPAAPPVADDPPRLTTDADRIAARRAWQYFDRNWNAQTGFVNSVENYPWTTWWDQGSAILGMHAAHQLGLIKTEEFNNKINRLLQTLERLPLPATGLPNKAYSTNTAQMMRLDNTPDPRGTSGWSALDMARFLIGLRVLRSHYPQFQERCDQIVAKWNLSQLVKDGWLQGGITGSNGRIRLVQEGRFGYEQYAAYSLKLWNIEAVNALNNPPVRTIQIDGIELQIDRRNLSNSGASNYLTSDPYLLWGLELGWNDSIKPHVLNIFKLQAKRFETTGILTAVNEDSIARPPYFLYYSVYANGQSWMPINIEGRTFPHLRFLSTKAAFAWAALMPNEPYAKKLRESVQNLAAPHRGYLAGRYENPRLGVNNAIDVNTNAVVLESLLYQARGGRSLVF
ncbi:DUF3131 domain-containing protein [Microseira sp. BLCC-F43]|uniref:DUF3131 domain-containing protein n=1 Tax=Microseira sp. BLCC-F43 TaxID=3153602 RepID=UPI0035B73681